MIPVPCKGGPTRPGFLSWFWASVGAFVAAWVPPQKTKRKQCALYRVCRIFLFEILYCPVAFFLFASLAPLLLYCFFFLQSFSIVLYTVPTPWA